MAYQVVSRAVSVLPSVRMVLIFFVVFFLVKLLLERRRHKNLPPGPWGLPLLGANFRLGANPVRSLFEMSQRYGKVFSLYIGTRLTVVISDPELVREAFGKKAGATSARDIATHDWLDTSGSLVASSNSDVKPLRRFLLRSLRDFGLGKRKLELVMMREVRLLCSKLDGEKSKTTDPRNLLQMAVANVLCTLCFGQRFDYDSPVLSRLITGLQCVSHIPGISLARDLPILFLAPRFKDFRVGGLMYRKVMDNMVDEHAETFTPSNNNNNHHHRDLTDRLLDETSKTDSVFTFGRDRVYRTLMDMFGAGADTTSSTIQFLVWNMAVYPDIQQKVRSEILDNVGTKRAPEWSDRHRLPYTASAINEVLRLYHPAPMGLIHRATKPFTLAGYNIPEGAEIMAPIWIMNVDPETWTDPERFRPERFLSADGKQVVLPDFFMPFGTGSRMCIGEGLARMELLIFFATIMQRFTVTIPEGEPTSCQPRIGFFQCYPSQMKVRFTPDH